MEVHPPHAAAHSLREFLAQLGTITAGVLIALSIEGLLEWNHYRTLVREAKATIDLEIADNKKELDGVLAGSESLKKDLDTALRLANDLLTTKKSDVHQINLGFEIAELSTASWRSAESTGALGHMEYSDVREYSTLYEIQDLLAQQQRRGIEGVAAASAIFTDNRDPHQAPAGDLELFRQQVLGMRANLQIQEQIGRRLSAAYQELLDR